MKKILILSPFKINFTEDIIGSPENYYFLKELLKRDTEIHYVTVDKKFSKEKKKDNLFFYTIPLFFPRLKLPFFLQYYEFIRLNHSFLKLQFLTGKYLPFKFDILICFYPVMISPAGFILSRKFKAKLIFKFHSILDANRKIHLISILAFKWKAHKFLILNDGSQGKEFAKKCGVQEEKIVMLKNAVLEKWKKMEYEKSDNLPPWVLVCGKFEHYNGFQYVIHSVRDVIQSYPDARFLFVGNGKYIKTLKSLSRRNGVEDYIYFKEGVSHKNISEYYKRAKIFVSTNIYSNARNSVFEAMLFETPVVAFNNLDTKKFIIDRETGILVKEKDVRELTRGILLILKTPELYKKLKKNAKKFVLEKIPTWEERMDFEINSIMGSDI